MGIPVATARFGTSGKASPALVQQRPRVTDEGLRLLQALPRMKESPGDGGNPGQLLIDGPFTDDGAGPPGRSTAWASSTCSGT